LSPAIITKITLLGSYIPSSFTILNYTFGFAKYALHITTKRYYI